MAIAIYLHSFGYTSNENGRDDWDGTRWPGVFYWLYFRVFKVSIERQSVVTEKKKYEKIQQKYADKNASIPKLLEW